MRTLEVNGLPLPGLLVELMGQGRWEHPGDRVMREVIPFLLEPVDFLKSVQAIERESSGFLADLPEMSVVFFEVRGSKVGLPVELPWLDVDRALLIAVNRRIGDDLGIALDYRTSATDPRVVASDWWGPDQRCHWVVAAETFSSFVEMLGL